MSQQKQTYGLLTTIAMIVGIVIGSGIYFRVDDILLYTGGDQLLGFLVLSIGACSIIFGSLTLTELAKKTSTSGGLISYFEQFFSTPFAAGFGWFQTFVYFPSIVAIVSWVLSLYTCVLLRIEATFLQQILLAAGYVIVLGIINIESRKLGGYIQSLTTFIKLIPLILIAIYGIFWTAPLPDIPEEYTILAPENVGLGWLSALVPLAFSYDGWNIVISIVPEVKNPKKNIVRALIMAPIFILITYLLFFNGMTKILGTSFIMSTGDAAIYSAVTILFGERIGNLFLTIVVISVLGVTNGVLLAGMRMPQALAEKKMIASKKIAAIHPTYQISIASSLLFILLTLAWLGLHYITFSLNVFQGRDVSEISVVFNYLCYAILYSMVLHQFLKRKVQNVFTGLISPVLAILGSVMILVGSLLVSPTYVTLFIILCFSICAAGYTYAKRKL